MSEKRFKLDVRLDMPKLLIDTATNERYHLLLVNDIEEIVDLLNEYETVLSDTQTFAVNLCKFLMEKGLDNEFREKYGDESLNFKMSNAIYGCGDKI